MPRGDNLRSTATDHAGGQYAPAARLGESTFIVSSPDDFSNSNTVIVIDIARSHCSYYT
jgi:hypothetical protein